MQTTLKINEIYKSIQGESSFVGHPFALIRLTGCRLRCTYCDTAYAFYEGKELTLSDILDQVASLNIKQVLVTGGEPLDQPHCKDLVKSLIKEHYTVLVETAGNHSIADYPRQAHYIVDIKTPSSKMSHHNHPKVLSELEPHDEVKFVIGSRDDYLFSKDIIQTHSLTQKCAVLMSCVFEKLAYAILVEWILEDNLDVRFQIQLHKHIWNPEMVGV